MLQLDAVQTLALAGLALFLGYGLCRVVPFLARYNLPPPVVGGLVFALAAWAAHGRGTTLFSLDTALQGPLMVAFFTTIGINASLWLLKISGRQVLVFLLLASGFAIVQNLLGIAVAMGFGLHPLFDSSARSAEGQTFLIVGEAERDVTQLERRLLENHAPQRRARSARAKRAVRSRHVAGQARIGRG